MLRPTLLATLSAVWVGMSGAAPPTLEALMPPGGRAGSGFEVQGVIGNMDVWPADIWCSNPGIVFTAIPETKARFKVEISADVEPGPYLVRWYDSEGASAPQVFVVGSDSEIVEDEEGGHGSLTKPQQLPDELPLIVNGRLSKGREVDFYQLNLKKGQQLSLVMEGYSLRSPIDPLLHIYDSRGARLAIGNDRPGGLDPQCVFTVPEEGAYTIAVLAFAHPPSSNVSYHGATNAVYRLRLSETSNGGAAGAEGGELPQNLDAPFAIESVVSKTEGKRIEFAVKKSQKLQVQVSAASLGSPLDAVLRLEDAGGKVINESDDTKTSSDPEYEWTVPADGTYAVVVSDRFHRSGEGMRFGLKLSERKPDFEVTCSQSEFVVDAGGSVEVTATVKFLHGYKGKLLARVQGLPEGTMAGEAEVPAEGGAVKLNIEAGKDAVSASGPIHVEVVESEGDSPRSHRARFVFPVTAPGGPFLIDGIDNLWLTVKAKPDPEPDKDPKKENEETGS